MTIISTSTNINNFVTRDICKHQIDIETTQNKRTILLNYFFCKTKSVFEFILGTKYLAISYDGIPIAEVMGLKVGHLSSMFCVFEELIKT